MLRLLWKEWKETKLLLLGLLAAPVGMMLLKDQGIFILQTGLQASGWALESPLNWIAELVVAVWAASRMPEELHRGHFSTLWLPVRRWQMLLAKFLPGLGALVVVSAWAALMFWLFAPSRFHDRAVSELLLAGAVRYFGRLLLVYCLAFSSSLFGNVASGALAGLLGGEAMLLILADHVQAPLYSHLPSGIPTTRDSLISLHIEEVYQLLAWQAMFAALLSLSASIAWINAATQSPLRRTAWGVSGAALVFLLCAHMYAQAFVHKFNAITRAGSTVMVHLLPSPDGRRAAFIRGETGKTKPGLRLVLADLKPYSLGSDQGQPRSLLPHRTGEERMREVLSGSYIDLLAWTPDSRSLFVAIGAERDSQTQIVKVDEGAQTTFVASLPPESTGWWRVFAPRELHGRVTPDGRYLVFSRQALDGPGSDIWSIDLKLSRARVIAAGSGRPAWNSLTPESLIVSDGVFREVALDGSLKREW